jgi:hypothetical protein
LSSEIPSGCEEGHKLIQWPPVNCASSDNSCCAASSKLWCFRRSYEPAVQVYF